MIWIIALLCLGLVGAIGYHQGPIRAGFSFVGLIFAAMLSTPLSPLTRRLLPLLTLHHPAWDLFVPQLLSFLIVLIIFKIAGNVLHRKLTVHYKYKEDDKKFYKWERMYSRLGFCVGLVNGAVYFFLLMIPVYVGGYFATEASAGDSDPAGVKFLTSAREQLHDLNVDRVVAAYDPLPAQAYMAGDILDLVHHNPLLEAPLSHYPVFLTLGERKEFQDLATDVQLQQMIQSQAKISEILAYPKVQAIVTNADVTRDIYGLLGNDLGDLQTYLLTGKSPKYESEPILGVWDIDERASLQQERKHNPGMTPLQFSKARARLIPLIKGLSLTATTDNQFILKKLRPDSDEKVSVSVGTWKKEGDTYKSNLPGGKPEDAEIPIENGDTLMLPRDGHIMVFTKEAYIIHMAGNKTNQ